MRELSNAAGMEVQKFYQLVMANIYKSPRPLIRKLMMSKALEMLETTDKDILEIAYECGYVTPNFFIASFYRQMRMTPEEYLAMRRRKRSTVG